MYIREQSLLQEKVLQLKQIFVQLVGFLFKFNEFFIQCLVYFKYGHVRLRNRFSQTICSSLKNLNLRPECMNIEYCIPFPEFQILQK